MRWIVIMLCLLPLLLAGCKKGSVKPVLTVEPKTAGAAPSQQYWFKVSAGGTVKPQVVWSVKEANGGTVENGLYTAPLRAGTFHVVATLESDPTVSASAAITIPPVPVFITPNSPRLRLENLTEGDTITFTAQSIDETGAHPLAVAWRVREGKGTITPEGVYAIPMRVGTEVIEAKLENGALAMMPVKVEP